MPMENFYVVRLPGRKYQAANGPVSTMAMANHFPELSKAIDAATTEAIGISEYSSDFVPVQHLAISELLPEED